MNPLASVGTDRQADSQNRPPFGSESRATGLRAALARRVANTAARLKELRRQLPGFTHQEKCDRAVELLSSLERDLSAGEAQQVAAAGATADGTVFARKDGRGSYLVKGGQLYAHDDETGRTRQWDTEGVTPESLRASGRYDEIPPLQIDTGDGLGLPLVRLGQGDFTRDIHPDPRRGRLDIRA